MSKTKDMVIDDMNRRSDYTISSSKRNEYNQVRREIADLVAHHNYTEQEALSAVLEKHKMK